MIMTEAENWLRQVESLFNEAVQQPMAERFDFLRRRCDSNQALIREVERLLRAHDQNDDFLQAPALGDAFAMPSPESLSTPRAARRIGPWQIVRLIGSGGIAHVWLARRVDGHFDKDVAIKIIKRGMDSDAILARFEQERQLLARLEHPNIARLIDGGATEDGLSYLVMEFVDGVPIDRYCASKNLPLSQMVGLFLEVCAAVQYAHQSLVIHRDIKPGNILVGSDGRPKLLDFGIAKLLDDSAAANFSTREHRMLTPEYASPEQLRGEPITTASDVFSLGVVLYELLTGCKPCEASQVADLAGADWPDPPRPSSQVLKRAASTTAATPDSRLASQLRGDLDLIVMKALCVDPTRRYNSAQQLADDLRLHQEHRPIAARPPTTFYRARRFAQRNTAGLIAALIATAAILAGLAISTRAYFHAEAARSSEEKLRRLADLRFAQAEAARTQTSVEAAKVQATNAFLQELLSTNDPLQKLRPNIQLREVLTEAGRSLDSGALSDQPEVEASVRLTLGKTYINMRMSNLGEPHLRRAMEILEAKPSEEDLTYAQALATLAVCLCEQRKFAEGIPMHRRVLTLQRTLAPQDEDSLMRRLWSISAALRDAGEVAESESILHEALDIALRLHGPQSTVAAEARFRLGHTCMRLRKLDDAQSELEEALELQTKLLGADHPACGESRLRLGQTLERAGQVNKAERLMREAAQILTDSLGGQHPNTHRAQVNLARFLVRRRQFDEAEAIYAQAVESRRTYYGRTNAVVASDLTEWARIRLRHDDLPTAEELMRQALQGLQADLGDDHPSVQQARLELAGVLTRRQCYAESEQLLLDCHRSASTSDPPDADMVGKSSVDLVKLYDAWCQSQPGGPPCTSADEWRRRRAPNP